MGRRGAPALSAGTTPWARGRLDGRRGPPHVLFGRMYEDASIELGAFPPGGRILCVASAGCTAMALAPRHEVVAVDINPAQLDYAARRFAGAPAAPGRAERMMGIVRAAAPAVGWSPARLRAFLDLDDPARQLEWWTGTLDTRRFRIALAALLSTPLLRAFYAPHLLGVLPGDLARVMRGRLERGFSRHPNRANPYARGLLLGDLPAEPPPPEAARIRLAHADAAGFLEGEPRESYDGFTLSNILDGADDAYRQRLGAALARAARPGAALVLRSFGDGAAGPAGNRAADDRAMLWGSVVVRYGFRSSQSTHATWCASR